MVKYSPEELIALSIVFMVVPIVAAGLRVWAVRIKKAEFAADDYLIFPGLIALLALCSMTIYGAVHGDFGKHQILGPNGILVFNSGIETYYKCNFFILILSIITEGISKISLLLFYHRIFSITVMKRIAETGIIICISWTLAFTFITIFQCHPVQYYWEETTFQAAPRCISPITLIEAQVVTDLVIDFLILVLPIPIIWNLKLPIKQRLSIVGIFLLGLLAISAGIAKIVVFFAVSSQVVKDLTGITYLTTPVFIWTVVEASLSLTCACLPTLRPIFIRATFKARNNNIYYPSYATINNSNGAIGVVNHPHNRVLRSLNPAEFTSWIDLELESLYEEVIGDVVVQRFEGTNADFGTRSRDNAHKNQPKKAAPTIGPGPRNGRPLPRF